MRKTLSLGTAISKGYAGDVQAFDVDGLARKIRELIEG
jgi:hypothetical protein